MESAILIAENDDGEYQVVDVVDATHPAEALELIANYMTHGPANDLLAPDRFVLVRRDCRGHFTRREVLDF